MATAKRLPSGKWRVRVYTHTDDDGKQHYKSFTAPTQREAERMAARYDPNEEKEQLCTLTVGQAMDQYIEARSSVLSPNSIKDYKVTRRLHLQALMGVPVTKVTQTQIQQAINIEAMKMSPKSVRNINAFLSSVLGVYRPGFSPVITLPKKKRIDYNIPIDDDVKALMADVSGTEMELPILLAAFGPMRRGEICALRAENINGNIVHVCENMVQNGKDSWIIRQPKSYAGDRYIDYPDFVAKHWKRKKKGRVVELTPTALSRRFERIQHRLGLRFRFHDLRHYSASIQHAMGVPDAYIMQRGGWSSDGVLKQIYRHALADKSDEMSRKVNEYFTNMTRT